MRTFRRLNDPERYYGLSVGGWVAVAAGVGVLYLAVRFSPLPAKPTISLTLIALTVIAGVLIGLSGQALGPWRLSIAMLSHAATRAQLELRKDPDRHGLTLLDERPSPATEEDDASRVVREALR